MELDGRSSLSTYIQVHISKEEFYVGIEVLDLVHEWKLVAYAVFLSYKWSKICCEIIIEGSPIEEMIGRRGGVWGSSEGLCNLGSL